MNFHFKLFKYIVFVSILASSPSGYTYLRIGTHHVKHINESCFIYPIVRIFKLPKKFIVVRLFNKQVFKWNFSNKND